MSTSASPAAKRRHSQTLLAVLPAAAVTALAIYVGVLPMLAAPSTGDMAVVFPPWVATATVEAAITRAGGTVNAPTRVGSIVVAQARDAGFQTRMRAEGAIFFLATTSFICGALGVPNPETI